MARFVSGDVVVVPFPLTDLSSSKVRPALVLASLTQGDVILCQLTSKSSGHPEAAFIVQDDFNAGGLHHASFALPHRVVTANEVCIRRSVGRLKPEKLHEIQERVLRRYPARLI